MGDKYSAVWVSHSSISDYLHCPRAYFLKNVYKDPKTNHKIQIVAPALSLGQAVHEVLESLSVLPVAERFEESLIAKYDRVWKKVSGKKGGFSSEDQEKKYRDRGAEMLRRVMNNSGVVGKKAVKIKEELPYYYLSEEDDIILCGKIDWLEYDEEKNGVKIVDFKTGKRREEENSLQLPIYHLLVHNCQKHEVLGAAYWYLETDDELTEQKIPSLEKAQKQVLEVARQIKLARKLKKFVCPQGEKGCIHCRQFERVLKGEGEFIGEDEMRRDLYYLPWQKEELVEREEIL
ncbi:PD-(D/E)XK nuclease family protein [Microgenomates group bacterium]|nr:PD-(D/E)XK nuclease family protein [Microgenomates group bacterium]